MPTINVIRNIDESDNNPLLNYKPEDIIHIQDGSITIGTLAYGMASGKTSVGIIIPLPDGRILLAETYLRLIKSTFEILQAFPEAEPMNKQ